MQASARTNFNPTNVRVVRRSSVHWKLYALPQVMHPSVIPLHLNPVRISFYCQLFFLDFECEPNLELEPKLIAPGQDIDLVSLILQASQHGEGFIMLFDRS